MNNVTKYVIYGLIAVLAIFLLVRFMGKKNHVAPSVNTSADAVGTQVIEQENNAAATNGVAPDQAEIQDAQAATTPAPVMPTEPVSDESKDATADSQMTQPIEQ